MLDSAGALLKAWRVGSGWTQSELAEAVHVTAAAISAWETGSRRISLYALEELDAVLGAGGCLVDLARAIGPRALEPRTRWSHVCHGPSGPAWAWIRPTRTGPVRGLAGFRIFSHRIDHWAGPEGILMVAPQINAHWLIDVTTEEPVWVDFGRGMPPAWLGVEVVSPCALRDVVLRDPGDRLLTFLVESVRRRCQGDPTRLRDRLRALVDADRWDALEEQWRHGVGVRRPPTNARAARPRPPRTGEDRRRLHRRIRETRGLSQTDTAELVTRVLRHQSTVCPPAAAPVRPVTAMQIQRYEAGRASRTKYLPALLDVAYAAQGWSCFERVPVVRCHADTFEARFPSFWTGPVTIAVRPASADMTTEMSSRPMSLAWSSRRLDLTTPPSSTSFCCVRIPGDGNLTIRQAPGWTVHAWMGYDPDARDANNDWVPNSPEAATAVIDRLIATLPQVLGIAAVDLHRALVG